MERYISPIKLTIFAGVNWTAAIAFWQGVKPIIEISMMILAAATSFWATKAWRHTVKVRKLEECGFYVAHCANSGKGVIECPWPKDKRPSQCWFNTHKENEVGD